MKKPTLHLLMGLPGSGKSTLAKHIQSATKATLLSSDDYRILLFPDPKFTQKEHDSLYAMLDHNVEHLLSADRSVIYDANLNRKHHREEKYALAKKYDVDVKLWWVQAPQSLAKTRRIDEQDPRLVPEGETSERMFDRIADVFEEPSPDEKHIIIDGTNIKKSDIERHL